MRIEIYTDGACSGNPGKGGYGIIMQAPEKNYEKCFSEGYRLTTNNRMELLGVIVALEALTQPCVVEVHSDSKYVVDAFNQGWIFGWMRRGWKTSNKQNVKNIDLWKRLLVASSSHEVHYVWVKGHAGEELNERCDELATTAADGQDLLEDVGFQGE